MKGQQEGQTIPWRKLKRTNQKQKSHEKRQYGKEMSQPPLGKQMQAKCQCSYGTVVFRNAKIPEVSCYQSLSSTDSLLSVVLLDIPSHIKPSYRLGKLSWAGQVERDFFPPRLNRQKAKARHQPGAKRNGSHKRSPEDPGPNITASEGGEGDMSQLKGHLSFSAGVWLSGFSQLGSQIGLAEAPTAF